MALPVSGIL